MHTPQTRRCKHPRRLPRRWWMQTICDVSAKTATPPSRGRCPGDGAEHCPAPIAPRIICAVLITAISTLYAPTVE